jgi:hypothetical protein
LSLLLALLGSTRAPSPRCGSAKSGTPPRNNAFTDLARFHDEWYCVFREADKHVGGDGKIRVLASRDGDTWSSAALIAEEGIDLRDPKICISRMTGSCSRWAAASIAAPRPLHGRQPRVAFSQDGRDWSAPQRVLRRRRLALARDRGTAAKPSVSHINKRPEGTPDDTGEWTLTLYRSKDGVSWEMVAPLAVPDRPNETTLRFKPDAECIALVRRETGDKQGWLGQSLPPYREWKWQPIGRAIGGPNFLAPPTGILWIAGRDYRDDGPKTAVGQFRMEPGNQH